MKVTVTVYHRLTGLSIYRTAANWQNPVAPIALAQAMTNGVIPIAGTRTAINAALSGASFPNAITTSVAGNFRGLFVLFGTTLLPFKVERVIHRHQLLGNIFNLALPNNSSSIYDGNMFTEPINQNNLSVRSLAFTDPELVTDLGYSQFENNSSLNLNGTVNELLSYQREYTRARTSIIGSNVEMGSLDIPNLKLITASPSYRSTSSSGFIPINIATINGSLIRSTNMVISQYVLDIDTTSVGNNPNVYVCHGVSYDPINYTEYLDASGKIVGSSAIQPQVGIGCKLSAIKLTSVGNTPTITNSSGTPSVIDQVTLVPYAGSNAECWLGASTNINPIPFAARIDT
jgi:hypothetical protein